MKQMKRLRGAQSVHVAQWLASSGELPWWRVLPYVYHHILYLAASVSLLVLAMGCSWTDTHGTHHLIVGIGFGLITGTNRAGVEVLDTRVLGAELGPDAFGVGYMSQHRVVIDPALASNVVVSVKANPFNLTVEHHDLNCTNAFKTRTNNKETQ